MSRFFFHFVCEDRSIPDDEGKELANLREAHRYPSSKHVSTLICRAFPCVSDCLWISENASVCDLVVSSMRKITRFRKLSSKELAVNVDFLAGENAERTAGDRHGSRRGN